MAKQINNPQNWGITLKEYEEGAWGNTTGKFKVQKSVAKEFIVDVDPATGQSRYDRAKLFNSIAQKMIDVIVTQKPILKYVGLLQEDITGSKVLKGFTIAQIQATVYEAIQNTVFNNQINEVLNGSTVSTPNFTVTQDVTSWMVIANMMGKQAWSKLENSDIDKYKIDLETGDLTYEGLDENKVIVRGFVSDKDFVEYIRHEMGRETGYVSVPTEMVAWKDAFGRVFDLTTATTQAEVNTIITEWMLGFNSEGLGWPDNAGVLHKREEEFFTVGDLFAVVAPIVGDPENVVWIQGFKDADGLPTFKQVSFGGAYDVSKLVLKTNYVTDQKKQDDNIKKNFDDIATNVGEIQKNVTNIENNRIEIVANTDAIFNHKKDFEKLKGDLIAENITQDAKIDKNKTDLELAAIEIDGVAKTVKNKMDVHDYTAITTQKALYDKVIADNILPGEILKITDPTGQVTFVRATGLNKVTRIFTYTILGDVKDALGNDETQLLKARASGLMPIPLMANFKGTLGVKQIDLDKEATEDFHAVREKEFKITKDLAEANEIKLKTITGDALSLRGASFNEDLAVVAEYLKIATPTGYTDWLTAINAEMHLNPIFDSTTGNILPSATGQWFKTNILDKIPAGTMASDVVLNIAFRGYLPDGVTLSTNRDQIEGLARAGADNKALVEAFAALTLYSEADSIAQLQAKLDLVAGGPSKLRISNILKAKNVATQGKFGDGATVNQQSGVANSKKEQKVIDDKQDADLAKLRADVNQALTDKSDKDLANVEATAHPNKFFGTDATGKGVWKDAQAGKDDTKQNVPTNDKTAKLGQIQSFISPGVSTWIDAPQSGPGAPVFELLSRYDVHPNDATWTEADGTTGTRHAFYLNKSNPITASHVSTIGGESYTVNSESLASGNNKQFVVFETDVTNTKSNTIRFSGEMIGGYYTHASISQTGQDVVLQLLWDYYNNKQGNTAAQLNAAGLSTRYIAQYKWEGVSTDLTTLGATPRAIAATSHPWATNQALSKYQFYEVKSGGKYKLIAMFKNLTQITGGLVGMITGALLEDSVETHNTATGGNTGAMAKQISNNAASITTLTTEKHNVPTNDGTATAGQILSRGVNGQESIWIDNSFVTNTAYNAGQNAQDVDIKNNHDNIEAHERDDVNRFKILTDAIAKLTHDLNAIKGGHGGTGGLPFDAAAYKAAHPLPKEITATAPATGVAEVPHITAAKASQTDASGDYVAGITQHDIDAAIQKMNDANALMNTGNAEQVAANAGGTPVVFNPATYKAHHTLPSKTTITIPVGTATAVPEAATAKAAQDKATNDYNGATTQSTIDKAIRDMTAANALAHDASVKQTAANLVAANTGNNKFVGIFVGQGGKTAAQLEAEYNAIATSIADHQFDGQSGLTSISLPKVETIGGYSFQFATKLTTLDFPEVTSIGKNAFLLAPLTSLNIPKADTIGNQAFATIVNAPTTHVTMPAKFNSPSEKDRIFGHWDQITFTWV